LFDLEEAYDTAWHYNILRNISRLSIKGNMFFFIQNLIANRTFRVQIDTMSEKYSQENGEVQGAVLSVNPFLLAMMDITSAARDPVTMTGYADDRTIFARHSDFEFIQNDVQFTVNNMTEWANDNGFRFSSTRTVCIHFRKLRPRKTTNLTPRITITDTAINVTKNHKILGIIFDDKLQ
jgi:hypothetical protein